MRYDSEHKERTRRKVLSEAAAAIRAHGPDRIGVAELMAKAGLTHGGFYAHFKSKDDLVAHAITHMFDDRHEVFLESTRGHEPAAGLSRYIDRYLRVEHRDAPEEGCPLPSLSADVARLPKVARERFNAGVARLTDSIAQLLKQLKHAEPDLLATSIIAELSGALTLSRVVTDPRRSGQILKTSRESLKARIRRHP